MNWLRNTEKSLMFLRMWIIMIRRNTGSHNALISFIKWVWKTHKGQKDIKMKINLSGREYEYVPYKDNLYKYKMLLRIRENVSFRNVFRYDLTNPLMKDLKNIANPKHLFTQNFVINLSGDTGSAKSSCILSLGLEVFSNFSYKNIFFFDQQILDNVKKFPENTLLVRDENPAKSIFGLGSMRTTSQLSLLAETCRKAGLNLAFIEPSFTQHDVAKYILETVDMDIEHRITRLAIRDTRTLNYMGAIYIQIINENNKEWIKYNEVKDKFIEDIKSGKLSDAKLDYEGIATKLLKKIDTDLYKNKKERKAYIITKFPSYTSGEIDMISTLLEVEIRKNN